MQNLQIPDIIQKFITVLTTFEMEGFDKVEFSYCSGSYFYYELKCYKYNIKITKEVNFTSEGARELLINDFQELTDLIKNKCEK